MQASLGAGATFDAGFGTNGVELTSLLREDESSRLSEIANRLDA